MDLKKKLVDFIKFFDRFGKEPKLYYKGEEKKDSICGGLLSIIYGMIYIIYLIYKFWKFANKTDSMFYDTISYNDKPPSIQLSRENFYGGFALQNDNYDPIYDETIYYAKAYFKEKDRTNSDNWIEESYNIELERCNKNKFGKLYKDIYGKMNLNNYYCFKDVNQTLKGHYSYNIYSYFYIQLFPCKNTTKNNNKCKPKEVIDSYLNKAFVSLEFQDVELAPKNYSFPIVGRNQDIYFKVGRKLSQEVHILYQILNIDTDKEYIGIDEFQKFKTDKYLKYQQMYQMPVFIENDIVETGESFCDITIKLYDQIRTQSRTYSKILGIWGDVGGAMEIVSL